MNIINNKIAYLLAQVTLNFCRLLRKCFLDYKVSPLLPSLLQKCGSLCHTSIIIIVYVHVQEALP